MKRYTLYIFPSLNGSPKEFNLKFHAWLYAKFKVSGFCVCELQDNKTGDYYSYWA